MKNMESIFFILLVAALTSITWSTELKPKNASTGTNNNGLTDKNMVTGPPLPVYFTNRQLTEEEKTLKMQLTNLKNKLNDIEKQINFQIKSISNQIGMEEARIGNDEYLQNLKLRRSLSSKDNKNLLKQKSYELNKQFKENAQGRKEVHNMELKYINRELKKMYGEDEIRKQIEQVEEKLYPPTNFLRRIKESPKPDYYKTTSSEDESVEINN